MCEECDDAVDETIEKTHEQSRNMYLVVSIVAMVMIGILRGVEANVGFVLFMVAVFVGIVLLINQHLKEKQSKLNDMLKDSGTDRGKGIIDYLKKNGWKQGIDVRQAVRNYTEGSLKLDLDKLCNGGIYCILDNSTGYFVDHNDYETLKKIYGGSIWQYTDN